MGSPVLVYNNYVSLVTLLPRNLSKRSSVQVLILTNVSLMTLLICSLKLGGVRHNATSVGFDQYGHTNTDTDMVIPDTDTDNIPIYRLFYRYRYEFISIYIKPIQI
jgi:hypothetical protein